MAADSPAIRGILNALSMAKIEEFFDEDEGDYTNLRLEKPFIDLSITYGSDKAIKHLIIGAERSKIRSKTGIEFAKEHGQPAGDALEASSSERYLAKDKSREDLFFVDKDLVDKLLQSSNDLRDKALASFQRWEIDSISLTNSSGSFAFTKTGGEWFWGDPGKKAKWDGINAILDALEKPINEWIEKPSSTKTYGLDNPSIHVILKQGSDVVVDCSLAKSEEGAVYARLKGESTIKVADPESYSMLEKNESDFTEEPETDTAEE
jgi:hypothetical protein